MQTDDGLHVRYRGATAGLLSMMDRQKPIELKVADDDYVAFSLKEVGRPQRSGRIRACCNGDDSGRMTFNAENPELATRLRADIYSEFSCIRHDIFLEDLSGEDRALTLRYQLPVRAEAGAWWDDVGTSRPIEEGRRYVRYDNESPGCFPLCWYPLGTISDPKGEHALTFAVPLNPPTLARVGYDGEFFIEFDFGLSAATAKFPSRAEFSFYLYTSDPAWGFRGALRKYYDIFPADFVKRVNREGFWLARTPIQYIKDPDDFGVAFHQVASVKTNPLPYDNAAGILTFRYDEPSRISLNIETEKRPEPKEFFKLLEAAAADPKSPVHKQALRVNRVASRTADGGYYCHIFDREFGQFAAYFQAHLDPEFHIDEKKGLSRLDEWWNSSGEPGMRSGREGRYDGVYIDSSEAWCDSIDFNKEHFVHTDTPLYWEAKSGKPGVLTAIATYKYLCEVGRRLHKIGKLYMANFTPFNHAFFATVFDVMGSEVWISRDELISLFRQRVKEPGGREKLLAAGFIPEEIKQSEEYNRESIMGLGIEAHHNPKHYWTHQQLMYYRRAMCYQKPYNLLLKLMDKRAMAAFGCHNLVAYIQWCLFWGVYPAISEALIHSQDKIRHIYRRYMPVIQSMGQAGWEPVTHARTSNSGVRVERFGYSAQNNLHFTLRNFTLGNIRTALTIDTEALKTPEAIEIRDAIEGRRLRSRRGPDGVALRMVIEPGQTRVVRVVRPGPRALRFERSARQKLAAEK
jgi:hypothetical protein